ncbi:acyltransferase [Acetobacter sp. LMG 32666]|uniref:acyltransferase family protein n=1 Tax=Acetobacter sp. LMG 32666 TaxID=2959295 RepID=UPI0030C7C3AA
MKHPINSIQMLRGIAALAVVLCHSRNYLVGDAFNAADHILFNGAMGVDLFFIISGFIMVISTYQYRGTFLDVVDFLIKRVSRVLPPYVIATFIYILCSAGLSYFTQPHAISGLFRAFVFLPETYMPYFNTPLPVGWTLNFEMYFYLIFSISLLFGKFRFLALCSFIFVTVCYIPKKLGAFTLNPLHFQDYSVPYYNMMANPFILEFLCGAGISYICLYLRKHHTKLAGLPYLPYLSLGFGLTFLLNWTDIPHKLHSHGLLNWGIPCVLIFSIIVIMDVIHTFRIHHFLTKIGNVSYTLYLTHTSSLLVLSHLLDRIHLGGMKISVFYAPFSATICVIVSFLLYNVMEKIPSDYIRTKLLSGVRSFRVRAVQQ